MWSQRIICRFFDFKRHSPFIPSAPSLAKYNFSSALNTLEELLNRHKDYELHKKIIYNDVLIKKIEKRPRFQIERNRAEPFFMKYLSENEVTVQTDDAEKPEEIFFPYEIKKCYLTQPTYDKAVTDAVPESVLDMTPYDNFEDSRWKLKRYKTDSKNLEDQRKWYLEDDFDSADKLNIEIANSDPSVPVSSVPCGGCGAFLHCQDISIPGFIPKEVFENKSKEDLKKEICQRCLFLREFDVALGVNVSPSEYPEILKQIRRKNCLAILMVDLLDFPCSYWSEIPEIIGPTKPIVIVGNKIDLLIEEGERFVNHVKKCLLSSLQQEGLNLRNVKHVSLISAKTGFGVNLLIDHLFRNWEYKGDVFLIGCTNVGKSTLYNTLIHSDYCSIAVKDIFHKATVSAWPGTTLKLLKFPITRPYLWQTIARSNFIVNEEDTSFEQIPFQGYGKSSFINNPENIDMKNSPKTFNPQNYDPEKCRWCFDTPGVVKYDQIINLLTTSELLLTLPKTKVFPRNFHMKPGMSLFIGGLARLDYVSGSNSAWFTVFASHELPVTITRIEDADLVYDLLLGSVLFRVPMGGKKRLEKWPKLSPKSLKIEGKEKEGADGDIVLSSAGWVAVKADVGYVCSVTAWTPEGRGICTRSRALIKTGHKMKGKKIPRTPAFRCVKKS